MNNKDGDNLVPNKKQAHRGQRQPKVQPGASMKKNRTTSNTPPKDASVSPGSTGTVRRMVGKGKEVKPEKAKRIGKCSLSATECQKNQNTSRKLSDASNVSEDLSRDSGCVSGKISSSDSSSEISDCTEGCLNASEGNQLCADTPSSESGSSGRDGEDKSERSSEISQNIVSEISSTLGGNQFIQISHVNSNMHSFSDGNPSTESGGYDLALSLNASGASMGYELADETRDDLVKENEELRSENEYLKDEMEEMRCEMLEMRDLFLEDEMYQVQELRLQLEQANKTCRILQYRLRKAERRSLRVAQTGQVDGELIRSLEHDVKVAKNVSLRLHNEVEFLQQKNSRLERENERLRETQQEMEVTKQVLQTEMEKARASSLKRTNTRSPASKAEKKLPRQDDSDLKCQLQFAKEESALMCKKLTKIMSESERMREELAKYRSAYGDVDSDCGVAKSPHTREAEVKVHLRLVEEEATLLSRRIVELEVENRGLRAEMSDMRSGTEDGGRAAGEEEEELLQDGPIGPGDRPAAHTGVAEGGESGVMQENIQSEEWVSEGQKRSMVDDSQSSQSQTERLCPLSCVPGDGPVAGEHELNRNHDNQPSDARQSSLAHGSNRKQHESLLALRDHACLVASAIQLLASPAINRQSCPPSSTHPARVKSYPQGKTQPLYLDPLIHLYDALDLLRAMLLALIGRVESLVTPGGEVRVEGDGDATTDQSNTEASARQAVGEGLHTTVMKDRVKRPTQSDPFNSCRDPMIQLPLKVLWVLHQHFLTTSSQEEKESNDTRIMSVLHGLWQYLGKVLRDHSEASMAAQDGITSWTSDLNGLICTMDGTPVRAGEQVYPEQRCSTRETRNVAPGKMKTGNKGIANHSTLRSKMKNWCYLNQEAAHLDQDIPFKTWDHPIMPLSFPNLDQLSLERSHTAPDKTFLRIYYSPPSARRVHLAHPSHGAKADPTATISVISAGLSPSRSPHTPLCLSLSANLSDDMKEMTASLRQAVHSSSQERGKGRGAVGVASSGTQTQLHPQMVSVGLQTDAPTSGCAVRGSPLRLSARAQQISISLDRLPGRTKSGSTSPKLYRRHSASVSPPSSISPSSSSSSSGFITPTSNTSSSSTASSATANRERVLWGLSNRVPAGSTWAHPANQRAGPGLPHHGTMNNELSSGGNTTKLNSKPSGANRYGLVTEFLRKMSGRSDKPGSVSGGGPKGKFNPSNPPAAAAAYRNDSVTRIVNQRFMKQREEAALSHKEGSCPSQNQNKAVRRDLSLESNVTLEDGHYDCSSSRSLTFCFARSSRSSTQRNSLTPTKLQRHRYASAVNSAGSESNPSCE
ncbi:hypothetical protein UPYG_G00006920 [Umbra pygmaea]|uniref:SOGA coiled-coil domain-containing protein n=1 Tax=Umbra pygmaea TaxID=75934 RepID=A0ABD0XWL8_UMBPY